MKVARRNFLSLLAAAPAAVPVAIKDAAAKMGLSAVTAAGSMGTVIGGSNPGVPWTRDNEVDRLTKAISEFWSTEQARDRALDARARASRLDPDLAAMRSVSPGWAYQQQTERCLRDIEAQHMSWLQRQAKELGIGWTL